MAFMALIICGALIGSAVTLKIQNYRQSRQVAGGIEKFADRLATQLKLSSDQESQIRPILEQGQSEFRSIATNAFAQVIHVWKRLDTEIRPLLTPEQVQHLDLLAERRERMRERWRNGDRLLPIPQEIRERLRARIQQKMMGRTNSTTKVEQPK